MSYSPGQYNNTELRVWDIPGHYLYIGAGLLLFSLTFYIITLAPTVIWSDSAAFAMQAKELSIGYSATSHSLFIVFGKLFSFLPFELAYSMNLLTAVTASITVFIVYLIIFEITNSKIASLSGSLALTVSHAFWLHAVITEVYDLNACFTAAVILAVLKWRRAKDNYTPLYIAAFLFGLGLTNHRLMMFDIVGIIVFILVTEPRIMLKAKVIFFVTISFVIGNLLLIYPVIKGLMSKSVAGVADTLTAEGYKAAVIKYSPNIFNEIGLYISYLFYQFPLIGFLLGFIGLAAVFRKDRNLALLFSLLICVNAVFFMKFGPALGSTKYTFYISAYMVFSILIGCGVFSFQQGLIKRGSSAAKFSIAIMLMLFLLPIGLYSITPSLSKTLDIDLLHARTLSYRDNAEYFLNPNKRGYYGTEKFAMEVFDTAEQDSIIFADHTIFTVLRYYQKTKDLRKDLTIIQPGSKQRMEDGTIKFNIIQDIVDLYYGKKTLYLADMENERYYRIRSLRDNYNFIPFGIIYKIINKDEAGPLAS